ncbi:MAG: hypothetical protein QXP36_07175 [Conexivisphaerales archaeon]
MTPLKCTLFSKFNREEKIDIFFSTTWCRDRLYTSENPNDILKFYDTFSNRDELIQWMKERPKGRAEIIEVEGDKEVIVVIPTADFTGKYAEECRENIFKGLHIIFVESGYPRDPYFNYAHNCNVGIKKAMEYNPKWIVLSNDDVVLGNIKALRDTLSNLSGSFYVARNKKSEVYGKIFIVNAPIYFFYSIYLLLRGEPSNCKLGLRMIFKGLWSDNRLLHSAEGTFAYRLLKMFAKPLAYHYRNFADFGIFKADLLKRYPFNESFINGEEDNELVIRMLKDGIGAEILDFGSESLGGGGNTMGSGRSPTRRARDFANMIMLYHLVRSYE